MAASETDSPHPEEDLRWQAHLFVLGELESAQQHEFSNRLQTDPHAAEAVVEAVLIQQALADQADASPQAVSPPAVSSPPHGLLRSWWAPITAVAAGLLLAAWFVQREPATELVAQPNGDDVPSTAVAESEPIVDTLKVNWLVFEEIEEFEQLVDHPAVAADADIDDPDASKGRSTLTPLFGMENLVTRN